MPATAQGTKVFAIRNLLMIAAVAAFAFQTASAQTDGSKTRSGAKAKSAGAAETTAGATEPSDLAKTLQAAAVAVGQARWSGVGGEHLPEVDAINTMEFWGTGTVNGMKADYHAALGYNPPAMRVELTGTNSDGSPQHSIQTVRDNYAWNESELGAGLVAGKGVATPEANAAKQRMLQLWTLPYGVLKAALAAGDKTTMSMENGATVITCPLTGPLAGITLTATLDAKDLIAKVETRSDNPALADMSSETDYSDYADRSEIPTNILFPGHIVRKQGGSTVLDITIKMVDDNNPYLVFPVPQSVKAAIDEHSTTASRSSAGR